MVKIKSFLLVLIAIGSCGCEKENPAQKEPQIVFEVTPLVVSIGSRQEAFSINVTANIEYEIQGLPDWIHEEGQETRGDQIVHQFTADPNPKEQVRDCFFYVSSSVGNYEIKVTQAAGEKNNVDGPGNESIIPGEDIDG